MNGATTAGGAAQGTTILRQAQDSNAVGNKIILKHKVSLKQ
jgi:hypothetical protein